MEQADQLRLGDRVYSLNGRRLLVAISAKDLAFLAMVFGSIRYFFVEIQGSILFRRRLDLCFSTIDRVVIQM